MKKIEVDANLVIAKLQFQLGEQAAQIATLQVYIEHLEAEKQQKNIKE